VYGFSRNALGWLTHEADPNLRYSYYGYDAAGNVTSTQNRRQQVVTFTHDAVGRVLTRTADGLTTTYAYDNPNGRWMAAANSQSVDTVHFDARGRVRRQAAWMAGQAYAINTTYYPAGPVEGVTVTGPGGFTRTTTHKTNHALQFSGFVQTFGVQYKHTNVHYNKDGLPSLIQYPTSPVSVQQNLGYNAAHLRQSDGWSGGASVVSRGYGYDIFSRTTARDYGTTARVFGYNNRSELTSFRDDSWHQEYVCPDPIEPTSCYWHSYPVQGTPTYYTYDAVGNRTDSGASLQSTSNRYQTFNGFTFEYDNDGNITRKHKSGFDQYLSWNSLGQLTSVTTNGATVQYGYNGFGERVYRSSSAGVVRYIYNGNDLALEVDGSGNRLREYTYFPGIDHPHSMIDASGNVYYYVTGQPGEVLGLVNSSGNLVNQYRYTPWGASEYTSEGVTNPLRFMSREFDSTTGLYYVRNRWYDPQTGRFASEDPIGLVGGINTYAYADNLPIMLRDPFGLCAAPEQVIQYHIIICANATRRRFTPDPANAM
jgi:RHS repeat-associated protein